MPKRSIAILAVSLVAACASPANDRRSAMPNMSIAWDAGEAVRHVFTEGCLKAVEANQPIKETLDRGIPLSRVRTLEASPLKNDPPGTPAYAVISGASVVMTGTGERCTVASSSGDGLKLRAMVLDILDAKQTGWQVVAAPPVSNPGWDPAWTQDVRCRPISSGVMVVQMVTAPGQPTPLQVVVFKSRQATCSVS